MREKRQREKGREGGGERGGRERKRLSESKRYSN